MSDRPRILTWILPTTLVVLLAALAMNDDSDRKRCFTTCELSTIGREFRIEHRRQQFYLVHNCPEHDRTFLEPVPREVWYEMREQGVPELRMRDGCR